jgi:hypothetical protein
MASMNMGQPRDIMASLVLSQYEPQQIIDMSSRHIEKLPRSPRGPGCIGIKIGPGRRACGIALSTLAYGFTSRHDNCCTVEGATDRRTDHTSGEKS